MTASIDQPVTQQRVGRLRQLLGPIAITPAGALACTAGPMIGITSSRLGHDLAMQRSVCRYVTASVMQCRQRRGTLLVAQGSAIEPWARRAAELFDVPICLLQSDEQETLAENGIRITSSSGEGLCRDSVLIALADRIDAVYVRRGGTVERCLRSRLQALQDASTRIAVSGQRRCAASRLINQGAIGWYQFKSGPAGTARSVAVSPPPAIDNEWESGERRWLVHCTRGVSGAWPGETMRQYRDDVLLGGCRSASRGPLETLVRIIRSGRLLAGAVATRKRYPVVCFSALSLSDLLQQRRFRPQLSRWDYEPYGVAIAMSAAKSIGIRPVIYGPPQQRDEVPRAERYRFHPIGKTFDWRRECEWRSANTIDLSKLDADDVRVFVKCEDDVSKLPRCRWKVIVAAAEC